MQVRTALRSNVMRAMASMNVVKLQRSSARLKRKLRGQDPVVHYFHQVDDPYSHLSVQKLAAFSRRYSVDVVPHLVSAPAPAFQGDAGRFDAWARRDAGAIAQGYGAILDTPSSATAGPNASSIQAVEAELAASLETKAPHSQAEDFATKAFELGQALWTGEPIEGATATTTVAKASGDQLRKKLGHYQGAMFWFDGEWYWGLDRLHLLETRLLAEGFGSAELIDAELVAPYPVPRQLKDVGSAHQITLEYFPSLRSPYTAIGQSRVEDLVKRTGVQLQLKPVMPMLMRGIPAPPLKQRHILQDASREARFHNAPFGNFVDPFGEPVKRAFALYPAAQRLGRGMAFVSAYLSAAFAEGVDISSQSGLKIVAHNAGIDFDELTENAKAETNDGSWETPLEANVKEMLEAGLWGVPSFRITGGNKDTAFSCWGQDRIWRVESEIADRCN